MAGVGGLRGAWAWYQTKLVQKPVRTQMITSGILWATGDVIAQSISRSMARRAALKDAPGSPPPTEIPVVDRHKMEGASGGTDWKRVALASSFGVGFVGPVGHFWYEALEHVVLNRLRLRPNSLRFIITKVVSDTFIFGPVHLLAFFTYMGLASGKPWEKVKRDVQRDFIPTFMTEGTGWMCVQVANFRWVPVRHQLLYVNCFCLVDSAFLSWVKHQDDAPWKKYLKSLVSSSPAGTSSSS